MPCSLPESCRAEPARPALTPPAWLRSLQELTRTRRHLAQQLQAHRRRLRTAQTPAVPTSLEQVVTVLAGEVQELEGQIQQQVQALVPQLLQLLGSAQSSLACC
jgi:transposase